ncbi:MAG: hypothetical protein B7Z13_14355 [Caulobacterales bacterium 32-67-6]|nr:MAG: hypothetical protein B7Z13_14355 [Caulobacterales bacterium 32-67-6]
MYDYLDQPVARLDHGGRFMIWSMRHWVQAMQERQCPACVIGPTFMKWRIMPGLAPFQTMMATLNLHARHDLSFAPCRCVHISEDEALLIGLIAGTRQRTVDAMTETLALVVTRDHVATLRDSIAALADIMARASLLPGKPAPATPPAQ